MKKITILLIGLFILSINIFTFDLINQKQNSDILYEKNNIISIDYKEDIDIDINKFITEIEEISVNNGIIISQYYHTDNDIMSIYQTNLKNDPRLKLNQGTYPMTGEFISNKKQSIKVNSGVINFPITNFDIRYYNFSDISNVGLDHRFYIYGVSSNDKWEEILKYFSTYGELSYEPTNLTILNSINFSLLLVVILVFVLLTICSFIYKLQQKNSLIIPLLWGYSFLKIFTTSLKPFRNFFIGFNLFIIGLFMSIYYLFNLLHLKEFLFSLLLTFIFITISLLSLNALTIIIIKSLIYFKGNEYSISYKNVTWSTLFFKTLVQVILFISLASSFNNYIVLKDRIDGLSYWDQAIDTYRIELSSQTNKYMNNLAKDRDFSNRLFDLYKEIEDNKSAFIMDSDNYHIMGHQDGKPTYSYTINVDGEQAIYSPDGKRVTISKNYLKFNPIDLIDSKNIKEKLSDNPNTLNLLVPIKHKKYEKELVEEYKKYFYFHVVEVDNIYNEFIDTPINNLSRDSLNINIVYTKNNQSYFTYKSQTGNSKNRVIDPVALIYNEKMDNSYLSGIVSRALYINDESNGQVFNNIKPYLKNSNVKEVSAVRSVYNEANDEIIEQRKSLINHVIGATLIFITSILLLLVFTWTYYKLNVKKLNLQLILGYSNLYRHLTMTISLISINVISLTVVYWLFGISNIFILLIILAFLELLIVNFISSYLTKKNIHQILKGGYT